jgi:hypothetical protein
MKIFNIWTLLAIVCCASSAARAQLEIVTNTEPQCVFFGDAKKIFVTFHNPGDQNFEGKIRERIFQASSAMTVLLSENPWKRLQVPAGEMILESATLDFPVVKAKTKFFVQWLEESNHVLGVTSVLVYPTNLFEALQPFVGETNFGVFDPNNELKPLLKTQGIRFVDLGETALDDFSGQLAIIGPFQSHAQMPDGLANRIETIAKKNVAVVWIQPPQQKPDKLQSSFYCVQKSQTAVVVVQPDLVYDLAENPRSQLNLIYFCRLALKPPPPVLPGLSPP